MNPRKSPQKKGPSAQSKLIQVPGRPGKQEEGLRLDNYLAGLLTREGEARSLPLKVTKTKIRRLIMAGAVRMGGSPLRQPAFTVRCGQTIVVMLDLELFSAEKDPGDLAYEVVPEDILFEDSWLLVLNKPAGLPTEGTVVAARDSLHGAALRYLQRTAGPEPAESPYLGLHHRLDRETSGVLLFTKKREANKGVHEMFLEHRARKVYLALTVLPGKIFPGNLPQGDSLLRVENQLGRISAKSEPGKWGAVSQGDRAVTDFRVLKRGRAALLWEARPLTGRTHQIRVHLAGLGCPLMGDRLYGGPRTLGTAVIPRVMLHARSLTFSHPVTGETLCIQAPVPEDFRRVEEGLPGIIP